MARPVKKLLVRELTLSREDYDLATMVDLANKVLAVATPHATQEHPNLKK